MKLKKIGEAAKETQLTPRAIRFYEEEGLIKPVRTSKGTRLYSEANIARLKLIKELRDMGFPLELLKTLVKVRENSKTGDEASKKVTRELEELRNVAQRKIQLLSILLRDIESLIPKIEKCSGCQKPPTLEVCSSCEVWKDISKERLTSLIELV